MFKDSFNLYNFVRMALPKRLVQIVDPNISTREVDETETEEDNHDNYDHKDPEAEEEKTTLRTYTR